MASSNITKSNHSSKLLTHEQLAWVILLISFVVCVFLSITVPMSISWYTENATVPELAKAQGTSGVTLVERANLPSDAVLRITSEEQKIDILEGSHLSTDSSSQVLIDFFDDSTFTIYPNSQVTLSHMRQPRFRRSSLPDRLVILVTSGRVRAQVATPTSGRAMHFEVQTRHAPAPTGGIILEAGTYAIESSNKMTHVSVRSGRAQVKGQTGHKVSLEAGERAEIALGRAAIGPLPAKRNLLINSDFRNLDASRPISTGPLAEGWIVTSDQGGDGGEIDGTVEVVPSSATRLLHFLRQNSAQNHGATFVEQKLNKLVGDYLSLTLRFDVRLVDQSLSGGGEQSSEFPIIIRLDYKDQYGEPQHWTQGFFCKNEQNYNIVRGTKILCNTRLTVEIDLKERLSDPQTIESMQIYASGWDWDVYVSDVELIVE